MTGTGGYEVAAERPLYARKRRRPSLGYVKILIIICACLAMLPLASCGNTRSTPTAVHYRFIQQITAYLDDGGVSYDDFVAHSGSAVYSDGKASFDLDPSEGDGSIVLAVRLESDEVVISIEDVETRGHPNSWVRVRKPNSNTFGSDTECEIWVGSRKPSN